jgi:hypothetical protein
MLSSPESYSSVSIEKIRVCDILTIRNISVIRTYKPRMEIHNFPHSISLINHTNWHSQFLICIKTMAHDP